MSALLSVIRWLFAAIIGSVRGVYRLLLRQRTGAEPQVRPLLDLFALALGADVVFLITTTGMPGILVGLAVGIPLCGLVPLMLRKPERTAAWLLLARVVLVLAAVVIDKSWFWAGLAALILPQLMLHLILLSRQHAAGRGLLYGPIVGAVCGAAGLLLGLIAWTLQAVLVMLLLVLAAAFAWEVRPRSVKKPPPPQVKPPAPRTTTAPEGYHVYRPSSLEEHQ